jgi:hypothetical protein
LRGVITLGSDTVKVGYDLVSWWGKDQGEVCAEIILKILAFVIHMKETNQQIGQAIVVIFVLVNAHLSYFCLVRMRNDRVAEQNQDCQKQEAIF